MQSAIVHHLRPEFEPVALLWSNDCPEGAVRFRPGRFGCVLFLFGMASKQGKVTAADRESLACEGGRAGLDLGVDFDITLGLETYGALFSKGTQAAPDAEAYARVLEQVPERFRDLFEFGERHHCSFERAMDWLQNGLPHYDIPFRYVLFKPLSQVEDGDKVRTVIFPVTPVELAGLLTLTGSVIPGTDPVQVPQGADCNHIGSFPYAQGEAEQPRAVLGMTGVDGREAMHTYFRDDVLTLALPWKLFRQMEQEAEDSVLQTPSWKKLIRT